VPQTVFTPEDEAKIAAVLERTQGYIEQRLAVYADVLPSSDYREIQAFARGHIERFTRCHVALRSVIEQLLNRFGEECGTPDLLASAREMVFNLTGGPGMDRLLSSCGEKAGAVTEAWEPADVLTDCEEFAWRVAEAEGIPLVHGATWSSR
jgi:hypothetical protein